ncbi:MAG: prolyl oligopeptidase family serine peptidase [bacterium]
MRRTVLNRFPGLVLTLLLLLAGSAAAQEKPTLTPEDYGKWESLGSGQLAPDGRWLVYSISRTNGEDELRIRSMQGDSTKVVPYGTRPAFSEDGRWLAYLIGVSDDQRERLQKQKKPVHNRLGLFDLTTGEEIVIEEIAGFDFSGDGTWIALKGYPPSNRGDDGPRTSDLIVRDLDSGIDTHFGSVAEHGWQDEGHLLAMIVATGDATGHSVQVYDPAGGMFRTLASGREAYRGLRWREEDDDLAVMRVLEDEDYYEDSNSLIAWKDLTARRHSRHLFDPSDQEGFPVDTRIVDFRSLRWTEDGETLFFGIQAWDPKPKKAEDDSTESKEEDEEEPAGVEVWHAKDVDIIPEQKVRERRFRQENFLCAWHLEDDSFVRLGDDEVEGIAPIDGTKRAVGTDQSPYEEERMFGPVYNDVYLVDIETGEREIIKEKLQYLFGASPGGRYLLYLEDDHYWTYDIEKETYTNITEEVPTSFVDIEDDHTVEQKPPFRYAGWTEDDRSVLLYDEYDIWEVRPDGRRAVNLTRGAEEEVRHRYVRLDREEEYIDPDEYLYLSLYGEWTKQSGYARMRIGRPVEQLVLLDKNVARLTKAEDEEVYAYVIQDFDDSPDYFVAGPGLEGAEQVTRTNPFQDEYAWGHSELVEFESRDGKRLQGALFYPADYEPGRKYPMITYIYEIRSNMVHSYTVPSERSPYNTTVFTQDGCFVFQPDIVYRDRNPGLSAVDCVVPAVEEVVGMGMVDEERIGLVGHSWGAYQTAFIVTQTDLFSAAVAGAPLTDLISMYLSIYWNTGGTDARIFEISQGRMEVPFWEDLEAYMANSALFNIQQMDTPLLVAFGDEDGAVDWHQGIELYNAARRAGKQFVLLVYPGENHSLRQEPNQLDYHRRIDAWFGHYLQGEEAPDWITEGVTHLERTKELERSGGGRGGR